MLEDSLVIGHLIACVRFGSGLGTGSIPGLNFDIAAALLSIIHQMDEFRENGADLPLAGRGRSFGELPAKLRGMLPPRTGLENAHERASPVEKWRL